MTHSLRIAVEGCGHGTLHAIYASIKKTCGINGWAGIDLLIIGGDFQAVRNSYDLNCMSVPVKYREIGDFHEYYSGNRKAPYLTIFVGGNHEASNHLWELYYGGWVAPNIYYMGAANVIRFGPLRIAGLSGIWKGYNYHKPHHERLPYNQDDVKSIYHVRELDVRKLLQVRTQVDIGISHDWPRGIEWLGNWKALFAKKDLFEADARAGTLGSAAAKYVMDRLRPSHWFAAHLHCKFAAVVRYSKEAGQAAQSKPNVIPSSEEKPEHPDGLPAKVDSNEPERINGKGIAPIQNSDEIELDLEDEGPANTFLVAAPDAVNDTTTQVDEDPQTISEELRAQLPASFARPAPEAPKPTNPHPEAIANTNTQFLALDKCLPNRHFLQFLEIAPINEAPTNQTSKPFHLSYDKEWLAITRVFASQLPSGNPAATISHDRGEAYYRPLIEAEEQWVESHLEQQDKMIIPENFEITAPVYDPRTGISVREQPREYTNPQTVAYCEMLGIENTFDASEEEREQRARTGPKPEQPRIGGGGRGRGGRSGQGMDRGRGRARGRRRGFR